MYTPFHGSGSPGVRYTCFMEKGEGVSDNTHCMEWKYFLYIHMYFNRYMDWIYILAVNLPWQYMCADWRVWISCLWMTLYLSPKTWMTMNDNEIVPSNIIHKKWKWLFVPTPLIYNASYVYVFNGTYILAKIVKCFNDMIDIQNISMLNAAYYKLLLVYLNISLKKQKM